MVSIKMFLKKDKGKFIKFGISILVLIIMIYALKSEFKKLNIIEFIHILRRETNAKILWILILGLVAVSFTTLYDLVLCKELKIDNIPKKKIFEISWISNTINNFIGMGGITGGGMRTALYKSEGIETSKSVNMSVIIWMSTLAGLSGLIWLNIKYILTLDNNTYFIIAVIVALYIPVYLLLGNISNKISILRERLKNNIALKLSITVKLKMIFVATLEWTVAGLFFAYLIINFCGGVNISECLAVFSLAMTVGMCSFIPGGIGSFDLACLYGFNLLGLNDTKVLVGILIYRIFYFVIPWILSMIILASKLINSKLGRKINNKGLSIISDLGIKALSVVIFFCGIILTISALIPVVVDRFKILNRVLSMPMLQFSQISVMGIGLVLIMLSKGIMDKVKKSYYITLVFLILGAILSIIKGLNIEEAIFISIIAILLYLSKERFYRESSPLKLKNIIVWFIVLFSISIIYILTYNSILEHEVIKENIRQINELLYTPKTIICYLLIISLLGLIWHIIAVKRIEFPKTTDKDLKELEDFLKENEGGPKTHLLFLKDKNFYYSKDKKVLLAFRVIKDKIIVLGDPIGEKSLFKDTINEFRTYLDKYDMTPIFYEINEENIPIYHENGYSFFKLGEEAFVDLGSFDLNGKIKSDLRTIKNKIKRGILEFQIIEPPFDEELFSKLKGISRQWLNGRKEKGFSLGWFNKEYINRAPIGIIKYKGKIIAFATLMPMYNKKSIAVDLMRLIPNPPNGTMDALFLSIIEWAKENGYSEFSLGVAPLSNVGVNKFSKMKEKLAKNIYNHGSKFYKFKGLRKYKEKFDPEWRGRYLAYPKNMDFPLVIFDLIKIVSESQEK